MKGGNINHFLEQLGYVEVAVEYKGHKYFFNGINYDPDTQTYSFYVAEWPWDNDSSEPFIRMVFETTSKVRSECLDRFFGAPLIDGKTFWELEKDMTWIEW